MRKPGTTSNLARVPWMIAVSLFLTVIAASALAAAEAEIISVTGKGDKRDTAQADWIQAFPKQTVKAGGGVRTRELSQMQIKTVAEAC